MRVCKLAPEGGMSYPDVEDTPTALQDLLGGYMEPFPLPSSLLRESRMVSWLIALADEDGIRKKLPYNAYSPLLGREIVGPVVIARSEPPEFVSLTHDDISALDDWFGRLIVVTF